MDSMINTFLTTAATVISGMVLYIIKRYFGQHHETEQKRDIAKAKENELILRSLNALGKLTVANSIALRDGKTNGEMSAALREYESVEKELYSYLVTSYTDSLA